MITKNQNKRCRIFVRDVDGKTWQLFSLAQNKNDGSIYLGSPEFTDFEWLTFKAQNDQIVPFKISQDINGHLSAHGSGQMHIKGEDHTSKLVIGGQHLLKPKENNISLRHLFTLFPKKPEHIPRSGASQRRGDQILGYNKQLQPFVIVGFAIPSKGLKISFSMAFHVDDIETVPPETGWFLFPLIHHDILLFIYRTKHMKEWPKRAMLQYLDGITVPIFLGRPERKIEVRMCLPSFSLVNNELSITLQAGESENN